MAIGSRRQADRGHSPQRWAADEARGGERWARSSQGARWPHIGLGGAYTALHHRHESSLISAMERAERRRAVDEVIWRAVNDPFVMKAWGEYIRAPRRRHQPCWATRAESS